MKEDRSIRKIVIASIRRSLKEDTKLVFTRIFEEETLNQLGLNISGHTNELPIVGTFLSSSKITLVTTQRILTLHNGNWIIIQAKNIRKFIPGDFKGYKEDGIAIGYVIETDNSKLPVFIESGAASMAIIYVIQTLKKLVQS